MFFASIRLAKSPQSLLAKTHRRRVAVPVGTAVSLPSSSATTFTAAPISTASTTTSSTANTRTRIAKRLHVLHLLRNAVRSAPAASTAASTRKIEEASSSTTATNVFRRRRRTRLVALVPLLDLGRNVVKEARLLVVKVAGAFRGWRRDCIEQSTRATSVGSSCRGSSTSSSGAIGFFASYLLVLLELGIGRFKVELSVGHARSADIVVVLLASMAPTVVVVVGSTSRSTRARTAAVATVSVLGSFGCSGSSVRDSWKVVRCRWKRRGRSCGWLSGGCGLGNAEFRHLLKHLVCARLFHLLGCCWWLRLSCRQGGFGLLLCRVGCGCGRGCCGCCFDLRRWDRRLLWRCASSAVELWRGWAEARGAWVGRSTERRWWHHAIHGAWRCEAARTWCRRLFACTQCARGEEKAAS